jgi:glycosyltransferase involved in cell wall biosynthesis
VISSNKASPKLSDTLQTSQTSGQALPLSVAIITKDEEANLPRLLESLKPLQPGEIIVVDSGSTDTTVSIARSYGANVIETDWPGHVAQKNRALAACEQPWILSLDGDEPISIELAQNLRALLGGDFQPEKSGYEINRLTYYLGDWLRHVWSPEWRLRLVRNGVGHWTGNNPHDHLEVDGAVGRVTGDIHHYSYADIEDHFRRSIDYARIGAAALTARGQRFRWYKMLFSPVARFIRLMIIRQGWRDGWRGWIVVWSSMFSAFLKYAFLYEAERRQQQNAQHNGKHNGKHNGTGTNNRHPR